MASSPNGENGECAGQQFDGAAHYPNTNDDKQKTDRHAADLALAGNQSQAYHQVAGSSENQQDGQCEVQIHLFQTLFNDNWRSILRIVSV
jgi:hypothetical protein